MTFLTRTARDVAFLERSFLGLAERILRDFFVERFARDVFAEALTIRDFVERLFERFARDAFVEVVEEALTDRSFLERLERDTFVEALTLALTDRAFLEREVSFLERLFLVERLLVFLDRNANAGVSTLTSLTSF